jgi:hypothetical protein
VAAAVMVGAALGRWSAPQAELAAPVQVLPRTAMAALPAPNAQPHTLLQARCEPDAADDKQASSPAPDARAAALSASLDALARTRDPQHKSELIREIAAQKAQDDLGGAWTWLTQHRADPGYAENARNLLFQWSYARPEHVAALLPQVHSGEAQAAAAQQLAQLWNKKDPHAYHAWVATLPEGPLKAAAGAPY